MLRLLTALRSDESLMLAYQRGDYHAFEVVYMRHKDKLFAFLSRSCQQPAIVEELAQEAWTAIINTIDSYQSNARFKTYLFKVAYRKQVDYWRRQQQQQNTVSYDEQDCYQQSAIGSTDSNPEHQLQQMQQQQQLNRALQQLTPEQRDVLLLREEGFSQQEMAAITGVGRETVKSRLRYAGQQMQQQLLSTVEVRP